MVTSEPIVPGKNLIFPKQNIVTNNELGRPDIKLENNMSLMLQEKKIKSCHLSISDEKNIAVAFVVLEKE